MDVRGKLPAGIAVVTALLAFPGIAAAVPRHVSATGSGTECTPALPCSLPAAMAIAALGDEVVVAPGDYTIDVETLNVPAGVTLRGQHGAPRPVLHGNLTGTLVAADAQGAALRHLAIRNDASNALALHAVGVGVVLDGLFVQAAGEESRAAEIGPAASMSNSVGWSSAGAGAGVHVVGAAALHNVTAWASGTSGSGIMVTGVGATATNTIARAPNAAASSGGDVTSADGMPATITMTNSNFAPPEGLVTVLGASNSTPFPSLGAPNAGDFHQLSGSPTVDAGIADPFSLPSDFDGDARVLGAAPDIGADEYVAQAPAVVTGAPIGISQSGATLTGSVDPNGLPTTYRFEYGATPLYGNSTPPVDAGAGPDPVDISQALGGLAPGSLVHYRLVASNADGESAGLDRVLIVLGAPPGGGDLPRFTELTLPGTAVVGQPVTLGVRGRDPDAPLNSVVVDFDDGKSFFAESACRLRPPDPAFRRDRTSSFSLPYTFTRPGVHTVEVTLGSGRCGRGGQTVTQTIVIEILPAAKTRARVRASGTANAVCRNADAVPTKRNRRKVQNATVCVLNHVRRQNGMSPFRKNRKLRRAGALHNRYMLRGRFFAHQGPGEPALGARLRRVGYRGGAGENLGAGAGVPYATARGMVDGWMNSPVHRANILEKAFRTVGVAVAASKPFDPAVPGATYTAEFGTTRR